MKLHEVVKISKETGAWFKRPTWHYGITWCEELGYFTTHYNCENCSIILIDDAIADDYIIEDINEKS